jgi:hypothetical protein
MEKNWLIRTRARQILGPVGKQKILDFVNKGSLTPDDEISSGNGYWFSIKEKDLLEKYVFGDIVQGFNPITEAPNVLTSTLNIETDLTGSLNPNTMPKEEALKDSEKNEEKALPNTGDLDYPDMGNESANLPSDDELAFPESGDLDYPDMGEETAEDVTRVGGISMEAPTPTPTPEPSVEVKKTPVVKEVTPAVGHVQDQVPNTEEEGKLPEGDDLDYPDMMNTDSVESSDDDETDPSFTMPTDELLESDNSIPETPDVTEEIDLPTKKKSKKKVSSAKAKKKSNKKQRNDRYLFYVLIALVLLIFYGAYYYFTNVISPNAKISNPFIERVYAQSLISPMAKKKSFAELSNLENDFFTLSPVVKGDGLKIAQAVFNQPENCEYKSEFHLKLLIVFSKNNEFIRQFYKDFISECSKGFEERTLDFLQYPYKEGEKLETIISYLKTKGFKKSELKTITKIWKSKNKENKLRKILKLLEQIKKSNSELRTYRLYNSLIQLSKNIDSYFLKSLILSASYIEIGNEGLYYKNFEKLISLNEILYVIDLKQSYVNEENIKSYYEIINFFFAIIQKHQTDENILKIFETNYHFLNIGREKVKFKDESFEWSLINMRGMMKSHRYGLKFPAYWAYHIDGRTSLKEVDDFVKNIEDHSILKFINPIDYWIFKNNFPNEEKSRELIYRNILEKSSQSNLMKFISLSLIENQVVKRNLSKRSKLYSKPVFSLKRKYLHENLYNGKESTLLIYKLLQMGEERDEFLWWLLL